MVRKRDKKREKNWARHMEVAAKKRKMLVGRGGELRAPGGKLYRVLAGDTCHRYVRGGRRVGGADGERRNRCMSKQLLEKKGKKRNGRRKVFLLTESKCEECGSD